MNCFILFYTVTYDKFLNNTNNNNDTSRLLILLQLLLENGTIVRRSLMADGTEAVVTDMPYAVQNAVNSHESMDLESQKIAMEEQLIDEVFQRPGLWNFKLPLVERSPQVKKQLWQEVFIAMDGNNCRY